MACPITVLACHNRPCEGGRLAAARSGIALGV